MFFHAFTEGVDSPLSRETIFTVEYLTSQILANAAPGFLENALVGGHFINSLVQELEFFGHLHKNDLPDVREYLTKQESSLRDVAKRMLKEFDNPDLRRHLLAPHPLPTT
jgi:hypothetical protein